MNRTVERATQVMSPYQRRRCGNHLAPIWVSQLGAIDLQPLLPLEIDGGLFSVDREYTNDRSICTQWHQNPA